jgi:hypothetical protein
MTRMPRLPRLPRPGVIGLALAALAGAACGCGSRRGGEAPRPAPPVVDTGVPRARAAPPLPDDLEPAGAEDRSDAGTVTIKLLADSKRQAHVFWGRKDLGVAPVEIVRPRGSAPLDLTVQAPGCLPLHTRAFTDRDDTLSLRLYTEREATGLPGYSPPTVTTPSSPTKTGRQN